MSKMALTIFGKCVILVLIAQLSMAVVIKRKANPQLTDEQTLFRQPLVGNTSPSNTPTELFKTIAAPVEKPTTILIPVVNENLAQPQTNAINGVRPSKFETSAPENSSFFQLNNLNGQGVNIEYRPSPTNPFLRSSGSAIPKREVATIVIQPKLDAAMFPAQKTQNIQQENISPQIEQINPFGYNLPNVGPNSYYRVFEHSYNFDSRNVGPEEQHFVYDSRNREPKEIFY